MRPQDILLLLTICTASLGVCGLSVCAFNVQVFGRAKVSDKEIVDTLASVFTRYDIGFMQEIRGACRYFKGGLFVTNSHTGIYC